MEPPAKIKKLDEVVVNRIAAGEIIQRPANALKELIENSLDAKSTNIQITVQDGGMKMLQIQDNGTGIRKDDLAIVCERFTTSKLQTFDDLKTISTFGFRGEALASISHVAHLTITTKVVGENKAYKASYMDGKLKGSPEGTAGNQGTIIRAENLFYNVPTRRKALSNFTEEFSKVMEVVTRYAIHYSGVAFSLKKHGVLATSVRTQATATKTDNIKSLFGPEVARELIEINVDDTKFQFKMNALVTSPNYQGKRMTLLLFINNRLVESNSIKKALESLYGFYLPKKTHPWCYISLEINPNIVDVNVNPTKREVRFLHEDSIIENMRSAMEAKLDANNATRSFYLQSRLPQVNVTEENLKEVLPNYDKTKKRIYEHEMVRTSTSDQKLGKFNFTVNKVKPSGETQKAEESKRPETEKSSMTEEARHETLKKQTERMSNVSPTLCDSFESLLNPTPEDEEMQDPESKKTEVDRTGAADEKSTNEVSKVQSNEQTSAADQEFITEASKEPNTEQLDDDLDLDGSFFSLLKSTPEDAEEETAETSGKIVEEQAKQTHQESPNFSMFKRTTQEPTNNSKIVLNEKSVISPTPLSPENKNAEQSAKNAQREMNVSIDKVVEEFQRTRNVEKTSEGRNDKMDTTDGASTSEQQSVTFRSYTLNNKKKPVKYTSIHELRKEVEDNCDYGLKDILSNMTFVGCVNESSAFIQSGINLYLCNTQKLLEELFYEILLYDFTNYGVINLSEPLPIVELAMLALETSDSGWTQEDGSKEELAENAKDLLLEKADLLYEYFSIRIDKKGNLRTLPILLDKYFPHQGQLPMYILRMVTEVEWSLEKDCFRGICRETARYYSYVDSSETNWKEVTEHVLYSTVKESLLPPKKFAHDSTILHVTSLSKLYKVFERC